MLIHPLIAALAAGLALWLTIRLIQASQGRQATRAAYFSCLAPLFDEAEIRLQPTGFPRMTGRLGDLAFDLQALPDSLTFRKLPALWVMVSLPLPIPVAATLDVMARPSGQESFSHFASLAQSLPQSLFLPEGVAVRTDDASQVPPEEVLAAHADLFDDPDVKELLISPKGVRIVILAEEADRGRFLIYRDAEVGLDPLSPARIAPLLERLRSLRDNLNRLSKEAP